MLSNDKEIRKIEKRMMITGIIGVISNVLFVLAIIWGIFWGVEKFSHTKAGHEIKNTVNEWLTPVEEDTVKVKTEVN